MNDEPQDSQREVEREERRLERLRLISVVATPERLDDENDEGPQAA